LADGQVATSDYEQRAHAEREKTLRLRTLRLAGDAKLESKPEKTSRKADQQVFEGGSLKTLRKRKFAA
jgi:hypothetical protein